MVFAIRHNVFRRRNVRRIVGLAAALAICAQALMPLAAGAAQLDLSKTSDGAGTMVICTAFGLKVIPDPFADTDRDNDQESDQTTLAANAHCVLSAASGFCCTSSAPMLGAARADEVRNATDGDQIAVVGIERTNHSRAPPV